MQHKMIITLVLVLGFMNFPRTAFGIDDVVQVTEDGTSASEIPSDARTESLKTAIEKGTLTVITNLIGGKRTEKNLNVIKEKIFPESSRYVQYYKATEPSKKGEQTSLAVTMKISVTALREILDREGLLLQNDDVFVILPLIKIFERRPQGRQYSWWKDDALKAPGVMRDQMKFFSNQWQGSGMKGYKVIDPMSSKLDSAVPEKYKHENLSVEEGILMAQEFKAQIVLLGDAAVMAGDKAGKIKALVKVSAFNVANSRQLSDVGKTFEINLKKGNADVAIQQVLRVAFEDVAKTTYLELQQGFKKGSFGSALINLVFKGELNYRDLENIKRQILLKIPEIRTIRERRLERGRIVLEGDVVGSVNQLVKKMESSKFDNFEIVVENVTTGQVDLRWSRVKGS